MTLRLLALLAVAVISAVLPAPAPAQDNIAERRQVQRSSPPTTRTRARSTRCGGPLNNFYESLVDLNDDISGLAPGAGHRVADVARRQDLHVHAARAG